jgi:LAS superfamily LD-carboxypeptidase LdcB
LSTERSLGAYGIKIPSIRPTEINPFLYARFLAAQAAGTEAGKSLLITSGFRSYILQLRLFNEAVIKYGSESEATKNVLPPALSHHPWGLALDINYPNDPTSTKWLEVNGAQFGLRRVYSNEWWHFEGAIAPGRHCPKMVADASISFE